MGEHAEDNHYIDLPIHYKDKLLSSSNWWYRGWTVRLSTADSEANCPSFKLFTNSFVENLHSDFHCGIGILAKKLEACLGDLGVYKS